MVPPLEWIPRVAYWPTVAFNWALYKAGMKEWYNRIDENVLVGGLPHGPILDALIKEERIKSVVSMNEDYELWITGGGNVWEDRGVRHLQLPVPDLVAMPDIDQIDRGVAFILETLPGRTYVHCKAGRSRSATLVACYLMTRYNFRAEQAINTVLQKRSNAIFSTMQTDTVIKYRQYLDSQSGPPR